MDAENLGKYSIGIATVDVTPAVGCPLGGFTGRRIHSSTGVYHPLRAVSVVMDDGKTPVLMISAELLGFYELTGYVRERISEALGIPSQQIVLSGTHTHCGPAIRQYDISVHGRIDNDYIHQTIEKLVSCSLQAWKHRFLAEVKFGIGRCSIAMNRRLPDPDRPGRVMRAMTPNPSGVTDHEVSVIAIISDDVPRGILFSYACHPTSRAGLLFGGDYVAYAYDYIQESFIYAQPCFLQGCGGDQKPRPVDSGSGRFGLRNIEQVKEIGAELGESVVKVIQEKSLEPIYGPIEMKQAFIELQTEPVDKRVLLSALADPAAPSYEKEWARFHLDRIEKGIPDDRSIPFEIQTIRFGTSLAIATWAAEMSVEHGLRLKKELRPHFSHVMPLAYTNDIVGYVPVNRQFSELGYEVIDANQWEFRTGRFVQETEEQIHTTVRFMLDIGE